MFITYLQLFELTPSNKRLFRLNIRIGLVARICRSQSSKDDQLRQGRGSIPRFGNIIFATLSPFGRDALVVDRAIAIFATIQNQVGDGWSLNDRTRCGKDTGEMDGRMLITGSCDYAMDSRVVA